MSTPNANPDITPAGNGRVKGFSGSGINAQFETQKEVDEHQDWLDEREAAKKNPFGMQIGKHRVNSMR